MNNLSWLIYLAYSVDRFGHFIVWLMVPTGFFAVVCGVVIMVSLDTTDQRGRKLDDSSLKEKREQISAFKKWGVRLSAAFIVLGCILSILPNRQTVMLVAASEIGQRALNSEAMSKVTDRLGNVVDPSIELLNTWISKQTMDLRNEMENTAKVSVKTQGEGNTGTGK